jgi:hypothetical protein
MELPYARDCLIFFSLDLVNISRHSPARSPSSRTLKTEKGVIDAACVEALCAGRGTCRVRRSKGGKSCSAHIASST